MPENEKPIELAPDGNHADLLQKQVEFNYMNFDRRRSYEWKLSLALWTAIAAFIALTLKGEVPMELKGWSIWIQIVLLAFIPLLQFYFLIMILGANALDKEKSWYYEEALDIELGTDYRTRQDEKSIELLSKINKLKSSTIRCHGFWSCIVQVGITIVLLLIAFMIVHETNEDKKSKSASHRVGLSLELSTTTQDK